MTQVINPCAYTKFFVNESFPPMGIPSTTIPIAGTLVLAVTPTVIAFGQAELQLNISVSVPAGSSILGTATYNFLCDGVSISQGPQLLFSSPGGSLTNPEVFNYDVLFLDQTATPGVHTYTVVITNNTAATLTVDNYTFVVYIGQESRCGSGCEGTYILAPTSLCDFDDIGSGTSFTCKTFQANQLFTPLGMFSSVLAPCDILTLPINLCTNTFGQVELALNLSAAILASTPGTVSVLYNFLRDGVSITSGQQFLGTGTIPSLPFEVDVTGDIIYVDTEATPGRHNYTAVITNDSTINLNINNYSFIAINVCNNKNTNNNLCFDSCRRPGTRTLYVNELFKPANAETVIPFTGTNTYAITVNAFVSVNGQAEVEFNTNILYNVLGTLNATYNILRDGLTSIVNGPQVLINKTPGNANPERFNVDVLVVDTGVTTGPHTYTFLITNIGTVNLNLDNYAFVVST